MQSCIVYVYIGILYCVNLNYIVRCVRAYRMNAFVAFKLMLVCLFKQLIVKALTENVCVCVSE